MCAVRACDESQWATPTNRRDGITTAIDTEMRLEQTWNPLFDPQVAAEPVTRLTFELEPVQGDVTKLTLTHELDEATPPCVAGT
jgi:hypothetical protein